MFDEVINVDLSRIPAHVQSPVFTVNSFTGQTFEKLPMRFVISLMPATIAKWFAITYQPRQSYRADFSKDLSPQW